VQVRIITARRKWHQPDDVDPAAHHGGQDSGVPQTFEEIADRHHRRHRRHQRKAPAPPRIPRGREQQTELHRQDRVDDDIEIERGEVLGVFRRLDRPRYDDEIAEHDDDEEGRPDEGEPVENVTLRPPAVELGLLIAGEKPAQIERDVQDIGRQTHPARQIQAGRQDVEHRTRQPQRHPDGDEVPVPTFFDSVGRSAAHDEQHDQPGKQQPIEVH
jgi:hypothetical protein